MKIYKELKVHATKQAAGVQNKLTICGSTKDDTCHEFILKGRNRVLLFQARFGVIHCCIDVEIVDNNEIKRLSRAIDTIKEDD